MKISRNTLNLIKFSVCTLAIVGILCLTTVDKWETGHIIMLVLCLATFLWYCIHVFTDNPNKEVNKEVNKKVNKDKQDNTLN